MGQRLNWEAQPLLVECREKRKRFLGPKDLCFQIRQSGTGDENHTHHSTSLCNLTTRTLDLQNFWNKYVTIKNKGRRWHRI